MIRIELMPFTPPLDFVLFYELPVKTLWKDQLPDTEAVSSTFSHALYFTRTQLQARIHSHHSKNSVCYRAVLITAFVYIRNLYPLQFYNIYSIIHPSAWTRQTLPKQSTLRMGILLETETYNPSGKCTLAVTEGLQICYAATECKGKQLMFELPPWNPCL